MHPRLLVICGPTATGKTRLALQLAIVFNGVVISADSRQVYKYMRIGTGRGKEKILGYDLVRPDEDFSVAQYVTFANKAIASIQKSDKLPILVGGTGLYIKAVTDGIETAGIPKSISLRISLREKSAEELFEMLKGLDGKKAESMNESDRKNSRRLVRAIEIAKSSSLGLSSGGEQNYDVLFVGLIALKEELKKRIEKRVEERVEAGFEKEVCLLKKKGFWKGAPSKTLGYKDWPDMEKWKTEEYQYAKRQMTWFKKDARIVWFDVTKQDWAKEVELLAQKWYSSSKHAKEN